VGLHDATGQIAPGTLVIVDGAEGDVTIDPPAETVPMLTGVASAFRRTGMVRLKPDTSGTPLQTLDGTRVILEANVDLLGDASFARAQGAEGIGLYRSELLLAGRVADEVTEEAQYEVYSQLLQEMHGAPVTVRTFDIDEDQVATGEQQRDSLWPSGPAKYDRTAQPPWPPLDTADAQEARALPHAVARARARGGARAAPRALPVCIRHRGAAGSAERAGRGLARKWKSAAGSPGRCGLG
jgi:hypothetical protein